MVLVIFAAVFELGLVLKLGVTGSFFHLGFGNVFDSSGVVNLVHVFDLFLIASFLSCGGDFECY